MSAGCPQGLSPATGRRASEAGVAPFKLLCFLAVYRFKEQGANLFIGQGSPRFIGLVLRSPSLIGTNTSALDRSHACCSTETSAPLPVRSRSDDPPTRYLYFKDGVCHGPILKDYLNVLAAENAVEFI